MVYLYRTPCFQHWINLLGTKIKKKKLTLDETRGAKLNSNWIPISTLN